MEASSSKAVVPADRELEELTVDERRAIVWHLVATGRTQTSVAREFNVSRETIRKDLGIENKRRRDLVADVDAETERLIGIIEAAVVEAWEAFGVMKTDHRVNAMTAPQFLKLVMDGAKDIFRLRGLEVAQGGGTAAKQAEVVVRIGGPGGEEIAVGVKTA